MPKMRIFGNIILSFFSKFATGYWNIADPTNGFTAIHRKVLNLIPFNKINKGYLFESDMLFRLSILRACVVDFPMKSVYGNETSNLEIKKSFSFFKRILDPFFEKELSIIFLLRILTFLLFPLFFQLFFFLSVLLLDFTFGLLVFSLEYIPLPDK